MSAVDDMVLVTEIADAGSFTQAGVRLGIPKSTVSQRIAQLEERLGLHLFKRSTRTLSLTDAGQVYVAHCRRVRAEVATAELAMANLKENPVGNLTITCPEVTASYFMPGFMSGFANQFPGVTTTLLATNQHLDLIRARVDFAFRVGPVSNQDFVVRKLSTIKRVLVASPEYLASSCEIVGPESLGQHRCLLHDALPEWVVSLDGREIVLRPDAAATSDSLAFLFHSCLAGQGVALLPAYVCQPALRAGHLVALLPGWTLTPHDLTLVFPDRTRQSKAQAAFRDYVDTYDFSPFATGRAFVPLV